MYSVVMTTSEAPWRANSRATPDGKGSVLSHRGRVVSRTLVSSTFSVTCGMRCPAVLVLWTPLPLEPWARGGGALGATEGGCAGAVPRGCVWAVLLLDEREAIRDGGGGRCGGGEAMGKGGDKRWGGGDVEGGRGWVKGGIREGGRRWGRGGGDERWAGGDLEGGDVRVSSPLSPLGLSLQDLIAASQRGAKTRKNVSLSIGNRFGWPRGEELTTKWPLKSSPPPSPHTPHNCSAKGTEGAAFTTAQALEEGDEDLRAVAVHDGAGGDHDTLQRQGRARQRPDHHSAFQGALPGPLRPGDVLHRPANLLQLPGNAVRDGVDLGTRRGWRGQADAGGGGGRGIAAGKVLAGGWNSGLAGGGGGARPGGLWALSMAPFREERGWVSLGGSAPPPPPQC